MNDSIRLRPVRVTPKMIEEFNKAAERCGFVVFFYMTERCEGWSPIFATSGDARSPIAYDLKQMPPKKVIRRFAQDMAARGVEFLQYRVRTLDGQPATAAEAIEYCLGTALPEIAASFTKSDRRLQ